MTTIEIPIRELHARTGHFVRLAARNTEVIVTERGQPTARLSPIGSGQDPGTRKTLGEKRRLRAEYRAALKAGALRGTEDSTPSLRESAALRDL